MSEEYNGWTNRETWAVKLHLDNDEYLQEQVNILTKGYFDSKVDALKSDPNLHLEYIRRQAISHVATMLEDFVTNLLDIRRHLEESGTVPYLISSMIEDTGSLWRVNWYEIAEAYCEDGLKELEKSMVKQDA